METGNWIPDINRFELEAPPVWVQGKLADFDAALVLIPSRKRCEYLLARRRLNSAGIGDVAMLDNEHPDTNMCYAHGLLPIAPLRWKNGIAWTVQSVDGLLDELRSRDTWQHTGGPAGNPDAAWQAIETHEAAEARKAKADLRDYFANLARDAYRSIKARTGQRNKRASDYHGAARPPLSTSG